MNIINTQATYLTANYMELMNEIDPYSIDSTSPEYIDTVFDMVTDLRAGRVDYYISTLENIIAEYTDDEDIIETATDLIEELKDHKKDCEQ